MALGIEKPFLLLKMYILHIDKQAAKEAQKRPLHCVYAGTGRWRIR